jgi:hypothetical protein
MGINPEITKHNVGLDSRDWAYSRKGFDTCQSVTLNLALFTTGAGFGIAPYEGYIPSGTALAMVTATGLYGPYDTGGAGGLEIFRGLLLNPARLKDADGNAFTRDGNAMMREGDIILSRLPVFTGVGGEVDVDARGSAAGLFFWWRT